jgi:hypothetical protein
MPDVLVAQTTRRDDREPRSGRPEQLAESVGVFAACQALDVLRSSLYRTRHVTELRPVCEHTVSPRALQPGKRAEVRQVLNSECFADQPPREVCAALMDDGKYLCS